MARLKGLEPLTHCLEGSCSIHLSYKRINRMPFQRGDGQAKKQAAKNPTQNGRSIMLHETRRLVKVLQKKTCHAALESRNRPPAFSPAVCFAEKSYMFFCS